MVLSTSSAIFFMISEYSSILQLGTPNIVPSSFIPNKYINWYKELCKEFKLYETKCMHVALGPREFPWILTPGIEMWHGFEKMPEWRALGKGNRDFLDDEKYVKIGIREALKARRQGKL